MLTQTTENSSSKGLKTVGHRRAGLRLSGRRDLSGAMEKPCGFDSVEGVGFYRRGIDDAAVARDAGRPFRHACMAEARRPADRGAINVFRGVHVSGFSEYSQSPLSLALPG